MEEIEKRYRDLKNAVSYSGKMEEIARLEAEISNPGLWNDQEKAKNLTKKLAWLKKEVELIDSLGEEIEIAKAIDDEAQTRIIDKKLAKIEIVSYLSNDYDDKDAIVAIHAGQGGTEAMDWAGMLFRMYKRYCEIKEWDFEVLDETSGEEAGIKSITFEVGGTYAYGYLKGEAGTHRLVRQSPFNADKLRQTSFALVEVLPKLDEIDLPNIKIKEEDLDWQFIRAQGHGGQNVNKVSTAVRLTHIPTGLVVTSQSERFQEQNRKIALNLLRGKLWLLEKEKEKGIKRDLKGDFRPASWGTQIRSYVLHPYKMVKDLRTLVESGNPDSVLDGNLDEFIEAELKIK